MRKLVPVNTRQASSTSAVVFNLVKNMVSILLSPATEFGRGKMLNAHLVQPVFPRWTPPGTSAARVGNLRHELRDRVTFGDDAGYVALDAAHDANLVDVEQVVHDGGDQVADADGFRSWVTAIAGGTTDDLTHP